MIHIIILMNIVYAGVVMRVPDKLSLWHVAFRANSPLKKAPLTGFHPTAKHIATKAVSPSSEMMRTI